MKTSRSTRCGTPGATGSTASKVTEVWKRAQVIAAEHGLVAAGYDRNLGAHARIHQHVLNYLVQASLDVYNCPLAMTDGAAATLLAAGNEALIDRALPRLLSRDPAVMWTSGQWMTERTGGSDVGQTETVARQDGDRWRLHGTKWFTSATTADMALTLARPEGNPPGGRGLAMFYLELRDAKGRLQGLQINRLKDKLGTRKVPTAELTLDGVAAIPVAGLENGVRQHRADAQRHSHVERRRRGARHAACDRAGARLCTEARGVRRPD